MQLPEQVNVVVVAEAARAHAPSVPLTDYLVSGAWVVTPRGLQALLQAAGPAAGSQGAGSSGVTSRQRHKQQQQQDAWLQPDSWMCMATGEQRQG